MKWQKPSNVDFEDREVTNPEAPFLHVSFSGISRYLSNTKKRRKEKIVDRKERRGKENLSHIHKNKIKIH